MPAFRAAAVANLADNWASLGVRAAIVPLLVVEALHRSPVWTGIGLTVFTAGQRLHADPGQPATPTGGAGGRCCWPVAWAAPPAARC